MKRWIRRLMQASAIAALFPVTTAAAQEKPPAKEPALAVARTPQAAVFTKYAALDASSTRAHLAALKKDPAKAKLVTRISDALAAPDVKTSDIEGDLLALVKGLDAKQVELTLDAIMRDHYDRHVATRSKTLSAKAAGKELEAKDRTLEAGVYGKATGTGTKHRKLSKRRHVRR